MIIMIESCKRQICFPLLMNLFSFIICLLQLPELKNCVFKAYLDNADQSLFQLLNVSKALMGLYACVFTPA